MFCPTCGKENVEGARFCRNCGKDLTQVAVGQPSVKYAGFWLRFVAYLIDYILLSIVSWIFIIPTLITIENPSSIGFLFWFIFYFALSFILPWLYFALMEASTKQATLGKMALGIIVTGEAGNRISFARATGRYFAKIISVWILYIGFIMIAFTKKKQGLHDLIATTLVIKKQ